MERGNLLILAIIYCVRFAWEWTERKHFCTTPDPKRQWTWRKNQVQYSVETTDVLHRKLLFWLRRRMCFPLLIRRTWPGINFRRTALFVLSAGVPRLLVRVAPLNIWLLVEVGDGEHTVAGKVSSFRMTRVVFMTASTVLTKVSGEAATNSSHSTGPIARLDCSKWTK